MGLWQIRTFIYDLTPDFSLGRRVVDVKNATKMVHDGSRTACVDLSNGALRGWRALPLRSHRHDSPSNQLHFAVV